MRAFFHVVGALFLAFATFVFVTWGVGILAIGPTDYMVHGANVYFMPSLTGFLCALGVWAVVK